ncbi:hypothetical protein BP5796_02902 [Coleophoma crateriformis]|uniref:Zn(2)-C6 fungal-type domain-containing protein n=1 Tax=Coleophoma crateriformis TaxID=565419 RepID=A0A3D8SZI9_9HELO|nr:hypothetical protein BP5796_02902 [Coleophoma crateriformis]
MATETRSRNGCWTCKLRRKKCDESQPFCLLCQSLNITCHGFEKRPEWMDGSAREKAELSSIKLAVAENSEYKRIRSDEKRFTRSITTINVSSSPRSVPRQSQSIAETILDPEEIDVVDGNTEFDYSILSLSPLSSSQKDGSTSSPPKKNSIQSITLKDAVLLMRFFEDAPTRQSPFSYTCFCSNGRGWHLWLVSKSQCLFFTMLALETYYEHRSDISRGRDNNEEFIIRYNEAVAKLQRSVEIIHKLILDDGEDEVAEACILTCILMVTEFNALRMNNEWRIHLRGASSIVSWLFSSKDKLKTLHSPMPGFDTITPTNQLTNLICWVIWYDILSNISWENRPGLWQRYLSILDSEESVLSLEKISGCQNWAIICILRIYALMDWGREAKAAYQLNDWDFVSKAGLIQQTLNTGIATTFQLLLQHGVGQVYALGSYKWLDNEVRFVTYIFGCAAAIFLDVLVSGANPALPQIRQNVERIVTSLAALPNHRLLMALSWPLCISGCMAEPVYYPFFVDMLSPFESTSQGNISSILGVLRECWKLRGKNEDTYISWEEAIKSLAIEILLV